MNYAEYFDLDTTEDLPQTGLLVLLDPYRRATRMELHVPSGASASTVAHGKQLAQQLLQDRYVASRTALPLYVLAMEARDGERRTAGINGVLAPARSTNADIHNASITAEYFDLNDATGEPLAGLLVLLDETRQPVHAELYVAASIEPAASHAAGAEAHRQLHHRYNLDDQKAPPLTMFSVIPKEASTLDSAPAPTSGAIPASTQWISPMDRAVAPAETPVPQPEAPQGMERWLPYVALIIIALGLLVGAWTLSAILGRGNESRLEPLPMGESHPVITLARAADLVPAEAVATLAPRPVPTSEVRNTYCIWPDDTLSEIAFNANVTEDAILAANPNFSGNAGTTIELPPGSILPTDWSAPPPPVASIEAIPFGISGYYIGYDNRHKRVALSFDVGFVEGNQQLMESLAEQEIRATFFVLGGAVENHPEMIAHVLDNGHELGNHSYTHDNMLSMTAGEVRSELVVTENLVQDAYPGATTKPIFRAPFGAINETVVQVANSEGYHVVGWTVDSHDWTDGITAEAFYERVTNLVCPGAIIAMHDVNPASAATFPRVLTFLRDNGYEFVTVSDILFPRGS